MEQPSGFIDTTKHDQDSLIPPNMMINSKFNCKAWLGVCNQGPWITTLFKFLHQWQSKIKSTLVPLMTIKYKVHPSYSEPVDATRANFIHSVNKVSHFFGNPTFIIQMQKIFLIYLNAYTILVFVILLKVLLLLMP